MSARAGQGHVLREARRRDSVTKRQRVLHTITELERQGEPISFAAVARHAQVLSVVDLADDAFIVVAHDRGVRRPRRLVAGGAFGRLGDGVLGVVTSPVGRSVGADFGDGDPGCFLIDD
ncbi:MAG: hypothetical protein ACRDSM_22030 [Pseudonocardiaceae bacterium]